VLADRFEKLTPILSDSHADSHGNPVPGEPGDSQPIVIDVVLHDRKAILNMLQRAETLAMTPNPAERPRQIALVLHGQEIENFRIKNYSDNRDIVDLAAKLDAFNVIDVRMCNTMMNLLNVEKQEIPAFIEIVPYGPAEVDRLEQQGFIKL
jgi:intracellular sulfur oxidation DsrE/DsrF family protein